MRTIRCWQLRSAMVSYIDDTLASDERPRVEGHLSSCETCRRRVRLSRAVRQRLHRWSAEMRRDGIPLALRISPGPTSRGGGRTLFALGAVAAAAITLALVLWSRGPGRAEPLLGARGQITDDRCAHGHTHVDSMLRTVSKAECVHRCVRMGAHYVFVSDGVVYRISNQDFDEVVRLAGEEVQLEGEVRQGVLTVSRVRRLTAHRSDQHVSADAGVS